MGWRNESEGLQLFRSSTRHSRAQTGRARSAVSCGLVAFSDELYAVGGTGAGGGGAGPPAAVISLTRSFNSLLGLKKGIFLAGTSTRSPVLGFRPTRGLRWRVRKLPKPPAP